MKKNLFIINEDEKNRILNLHETATKNQYLFEQASTGTTTAATTNTTSTVTTSGRTASVRATTAKCPAGSSKCNEQGIRIQVKINDECDPSVLNTALTNHPKAATGVAGSLKLKEDGVIGKGTNAAFAACKSYLIPKGQQTASTTGAPLGTQQPEDLGSATTADQYATLSA